jgi:hypothetical protein
MSASSAEEARQNGPLEIHIDLARTVPLTQFTFGIVVLNLLEVRGTR